MEKQYRSAIGTTYETSFSLENKEIPVRHTVIGDEITKIEVKVNGKWKDSDALFDVFIGLCYEHLGELK